MHVKILTVSNLADEREYSFCYVWNSLPDYVVEADSVNSWANQEFVYNFNSELIGTGGLPVCM